MSGTALRAAGPPAPRNSLATRLGRLREIGIIAVAVLVAIYFGLTTSNFLTEPSLVTLSQFIAASAIIACGEIMLMICGEIDLSIGQVYALAPFLMYFAHASGLPYVAALLAALAACCVVGLINGLVTAMLRVPSFIATLGMLYLLNGLTLTISRGQPVEAPTDAPVLAQALGGWSWSEILWALGVTLLMHGLLRHTRWGLHTVAAGGNATGASEAGINVRRIKIGNFVLASLLGGLTGILEMFRVGSADPLAGGSNVMFLAVAAGVIGGTPLVGGSGTIIGGFFGVIVLSLLRDGFTMQGVNAYTFDLITGAAILAAMVANIYLEALKRRGGTR